MSNTKEINTNINRSELLSDNAFIIQLLSSTQKLSKNEIESLALKAKSGDTKAIMLVASACLGLVYSMSARYSWSESNLGDRFQNGVEGLLNSFNSYDPEKGACFTTHAIPWIRKYINRSADKEQYMCQSLEFNEDFKSDTEHPFLVDDSDRLNMEQNWVKNSLDNILMPYPEEEHKYLQNYYGLNDSEPLSIPKIAERYNVSRDHVNRILKKGRERLTRDKDARDLWESCSIAS